MGKWKEEITENKNELQDKEFTYLINKPNRNTTQNYPQNNHYHQERNYPQNNHYHKERNYPQNRNYHQERNYPQNRNYHQERNYPQNRNYHQERNYQQNRNYPQNRNYHQERNYPQNDNQNNYKPPKPILSVTEKNFPTLNENKVQQELNTCWGKNLKKVKEEPKEEEIQKLNLNYKIKEAKPQIQLPKIPLCASILYPDYFKNRETFKQLYLNEMNGNQISVQ